MARTLGTDTILDAAATWRDRCLLSDGSVFSEASLWSREWLPELTEYFVERPDSGDGTFLEKLAAQLAPTSAEAKQLAAEMLWVLLLFPSNIRRDTKVATITTVWNWSGSELPEDHPMLLAMAAGIGGGGQAYNTFRWLELQFFIRVMQDWKALSADDQRSLTADPWSFAGWVDAVEGADRRQFRHMLLHLLFPDVFERVSSPNHKALIDSAFNASIEPSQFAPEEVGTTAIARDGRLLRARHLLEHEEPGEPLDFYVGDLYERWRPPPTPIQQSAAAPRPEPRPVATVREASPSRESDDEPTPDATNLDAVFETLETIGLRLSERTLRRYSLSLDARGFVILSGISGTGKTWLAEAYAAAVGARSLVVPVAPNWTTNEDLLGFADPISGEYRDTAFSRFLRDAAAEYADSRRAGRTSKQYHLILDEMNLARVEYYFATFLSAMELRMRAGDARIELGPKGGVPLTPNLKFIGTINVDETTHGFADKVYDRAQVIEMTVSRNDLEAYLGGSPYRESLLEVWDVVHTVAPFAFRVLDDTGRYVAAAQHLGIPWEELLDEVILQKVLPKIRGADPEIGDVLSRLEGLTADRFPLSNAKIASMRSAFQQHGVASYF